MKTFSIPLVGSKVRVTTRYRETYYFATNPWRDTVFEGEVVKTDKWDGPDYFKVFTGNPEFPNSTININSVHNIEYIEGGPGREINSDTRTWLVKGSKGDSYTVSQLGTKWSCTCSGFQFRRQCKHVKEKQDA
jgi:hypothetical protein